jgi:hypothetical protein
MKTDSHGLRYSAWPSLDREFYERGLEIQARAGFLRRRQISHITQKGRLTDYGHALTCLFSVGSFVNQSTRRIEVAKRNIGNSRASAAGIARS